MKQVRRWGTKSPAAGRTLKTKLTRENSTTISGKLKFMVAEVF